MKRAVFTILCLVVSALLVLAHQGIYHVAYALDLPIFDFPELIMEAPGFFIAIRVILGIENACVCRFVIGLWCSAKPGVLTARGAWIISGFVGFAYVFWNAACCILIHTWPDPWDSSFWVGLIGTVHDSALYTVLFLGFPFMFMHGHLGQLYCNLPCGISVMPSLIMAIVNDIVVDFVRLPQLQEIWYIGPLILTYLVTVFFPWPTSWLGVGIDGSTARPWFLLLAWTLVMFDFTYYATAFLLELTPEHGVNPMIAVLVSSSMFALARPLILRAVRHVLGHDNTSEVAEPFVWGVQVAEHWVPTVIFLKLTFFTPAFFVTSFLEDMWNLFRDVALRDAAIGLLRKASPSRFGRWTRSRSVRTKHLHLAMQNSFSRMWSTTLMALMILLDLVVCCFGGKAVITPHASQNQRWLAVLGFLYLLMWDTCLSKLAIRLIRSKINSSMDESDACVDFSPLQHRNMAEYFWDCRHLLLSGILWATLGTVDILHDNTKIWT